MREPDELGKPGKSTEGTKRTRRVRVEKSGKLTLPAPLARKLGADPGDRIEIVEERGRIELRPNIHSLGKVYIEPTSRCNLACRTCIRNTWDEPMGDMDEATFHRLASQLAGFPHLESVMFGGFGEPMAHPRILEMVRAIKALGVRVEMTTNGTLLQGPLLDGPRPQRPRPDLGVLRRSGRIPVRIDPAGRPVQERPRKPEWTSRAEQAGKTPLGRRNLLRRHEEKRR